MDVKVRIYVKLKPDNGEPEKGLPDLGMGPGIIGYQEAIWRDEKNPQSPIFLASILDLERSVVEGFIDTQIQIAFENCSEEEAAEHLAYFTRPEPEEEL